MSGQVRAQEAGTSEGLLRSGTGLGLERESVNTGSGEQKTGQQTYPDVLEFLNRRLRQGRQERGTWHPTWLVVRFPCDEKQFIANCNHNSQLSAVVSINSIQVASWE